MGLSFGSHLPGGKDLRKAVDTAKRLNFTCFQVFLQGPTNSRMPKNTESLDLEVAQQIAEAGLELFIHGPYLMNFGSSKLEVRANSVTMLKTNLERAQRLGAKGVIFHGGSSTGNSYEEGLDALRGSLLPVLQELPAGSPTVILEPTAGQGDSLVSTVSSIPRYLEALDSHPSLQLCLDTAHLLAAGESLDEPFGGDRLLEQLESLDLMERVALFHTNDSMFGRGSHKDRHENLGYGKCHQNIWRQLAFSSIPFILETPGAHFNSDVKLLRKLSTTV